MKRTISFITAATVLFLASCGKDNKTGPDNNGNKATSLPVNCDFVTIKPSAVMQNVSGVNYTYASPLRDILNSDATWKSCIPDGTDSISIGSQYWHGTVLHGVLIADVSNLPAINKITLKAQNGDTYRYTQVRLCDGSNIVAETEPNNESGNVTLTLNVGGKKAARLYINSTSTVVFSVLIE